MAFLELANLGTALVIALAPAAAAAGAATATTASAVKPAAYRHGKPAVPKPVNMTKPMKAVPMRADDSGDGDRFLYDSCGCGGS